MSEARAVRSGVRGRHALVILAMGLLAAIFGPGAFCRDSDSMAAVREQIRARLELPLDPSLQNARIRRFHDSLDLIAFYEKHLF
jgi:hypothetical protein